jgi:hypothetical protein
MPAQHHAINRHAPARIDELTTQMLATAGVQRDAKVLDLQPEVRIHLPPARSQQRTLWLPGAVARGWDSEFESALLQQGVRKRTVRHLGISVIDSAPAASLVRPPRCSSSSER